MSRQNLVWNADAAPPAIPAVRITVNTAPAQRAADRRQDVDLGRRVRQLRGADRLVRGGGGRLHGRRQRRAAHQQQRLHQHLVGGVDAIAVEAGVSTRTIYNHLANKEELFTEVLRTSASEVADAFIATVARTAGDPPDLVAIGGRALVAQRAEHVEHFSMMRHINVEAGHFPREVLATWREARPPRMEREVARQLRRLAGHGLLRDDAWPGWPGTSSCSLRRRSHRAST